MTLFSPRSRSCTDQLDAKVREKLASSIEHILSIGRVAAAAQVDAASFIAQVRDRRQSPGLFGRYFDVVFAIRSNDLGHAAALLEEMEAMSAAGSRFTVKPLSEETMGRDAERYARILGRGDEAVFSPPLDGDWEEFDLRVHEARGSLNIIHSALAAEAEGLLVEVVGSVPASSGRSFGSASSLTLWGAAVMNLHQHRTVIDLMDGLVHETAHHILFALAVDEPLVLNPIQARFGSPLRSDPRPMDGVFHATFVCARLHILYAAMIENARLQSPLEVQSLRLRLEDQRTRVEDGLSTIVAHADLTGTGTAVLESMRSYMADAA